MSKFRNWLEEWFGIPAEENDNGGSDPARAKSGPKTQGDFHVLRVQPTPNPHAFQFVINAPIIASGTKTFENADDAKGDPFAEALFQIFGVENVYLKESFVTVTKSEAVGWHTVFEKIGETIEEKVTFYNAPGEAEGQTKSDAETILDKFHKEDFPNCNAEEKTLIIEAVLDQAIRPALANDGGGIDVLGVEDNVVKIHYQGACGTCPSSTTGTLSYIETFLKDTLHPDLTVQAQ
ncbi:scaffolding protein [Candidatus Nitromaritima sp. SCGC AAA799-A02]|nr:scaffolding protein [Candidatus Nitromaritima sp. SCGC AAA799-A02]